MSGSLTSLHAMIDKRLSLDGSSDEDEMSGVFLQSGPPFTPRDIDHWNYHVNLQQFGKDLQAAAKAVFPNESSSRYTQVSVLMLSWEDEDPQLPVSIEIEKLYDVFQHVYYFETEHWKIPNDNCHYMLTEKIMDFVAPTDNIAHHLKIVYYAGHARLTVTRSLAWMSFRSGGKSGCPIVKWSGIQTVLEEAPCDVLILLDCCASGIANTCEGNGVNEVISACAYNATANGVGPYSFTSALVIELQRLSKRTSFSVGELYRNIFIRTQIRMPEEIPEQGRERERHPAPIHLVLTEDNQPPRAILLSVRVQPGHDAQNLSDANKANNDSQTLSYKESGRPRAGPATFDSVKPGHDLPSQFDPIYGEDGLLSNTQRVPRLAFAIRLRDTFQPGEQLKNLFLEWLRNMPTIAEEVSIEAGFDSFSTLLIVSLPISLSSYLPRNDAVISLGPITSVNRISCDGDPEVFESYLGWGAVSQSASIFSRPESIFDGAVTASDVFSQNTEPTSVDLSNLDLTNSPRPMQLNSLPETTSRQLEEHTTALDKIFLETVVFHHQIYQKYAIKNGIYHVPSDEKEIERLHIMHNVLQRVFDGRLIFPPLYRPRRILDCGYGAGSWAIEVAEQHPRCEILGIDINPAMLPENIPENLYPQVDDLNRRFTFPAHSFDLVHSQMMVQGIHANRWSQYLGDMFRVTRPGGWCQMVEMYLNVQSENESLTDAHALKQWSTRYFQSLEDTKDLRAPLRLPSLMRAAGFVDVESRMIPLPTCAWPTDTSNREIGAQNRENVQRMLSSFALYPFTEFLGMPIQDVQLLVAQARIEADDIALKPYFPLYICIGRKSQIIGRIR